MYGPNIRRNHFLTAPQNAFSNFEILHAYYQTLDCMKLTMLVLVTEISSYKLEL